MKPYAKDIRIKAETLLNEGASMRETARTVGVHHKTIARWFPGRGWSKRDAGLFSAMQRRLEGL